MNRADKQAAKMNLHPCFAPKLKTKRLTNLMNVAYKFATLRRLARALTSLPISEAKESPTTTKPAKTGARLPAR